MQSMNQMLLRKQAPSMQHQQNLKTLFEEIFKIIAPEDYKKFVDGDNEFILNKYPRVAQLLLENDMFFVIFKGLLEIEKNKPEDERKEFWKVMDPLCHGCELNCSSY